MMEASAHSKEPEPNKKGTLPCPTQSEVFFTPMRESSSNNDSNSSKRQNGSSTKVLPKNLPSLKKSGDNLISNMVPLSIVNKIQEARKTAALKPSNQLGQHSPPPGTPASTDVHASEQTTHSMKPTFSEVLRNGEPGGWKLAGKKGKNSKLTQGTLAGARVKVAERSAHLFTKGWSPEETENGVINFLKNNHNISADCSKIETKATAYKCFKVSFNVFQNINFHDPALWPVGVAVGKYHNRSNTQSKKTNVERTQRRIF